jgi:hypothetical protein
MLIGTSRLDIDSRLSTSSSMTAERKSNVQLDGSRIGGAECAAIAIPNDSLSMFFYRFRRYISNWF